MRDWVISQRLYDQWYRMLHPAAPSSFPYRALLDGRDLDRISAARERRQRRNDIRLHNVSRGGFR